MLDVVYCSYIIHCHISNPHFAWIQAVVSKEEQWNCRLDSVSVYR
uniref:Uncharacterized protein n=1 Tax=Rhizophora mucronata TaxID=61149 RepID=A0A2P2P9X3_RHIMU